MKGPEDSRIPYPSYMLSTTQVLDRLEFEEVRREVAKRGDSEGTKQRWYPYGERQFVTGWVTD